MIEALTRAINDHDAKASGSFFESGGRFVTAMGNELDAAGVERMLGGSFTAFPDLTLRIERWVIDGDVVVTEEVMEGTHEGPFAGLPPTGRRIRLPMAHVSRVEGDHIVERIAYHDTAALIRQLS